MRRDANPRCGDTNHADWNASAGCEGWNNAEVAPPLYAGNECGPMHGKDDDEGQDVFYVLGDGNHAVDSGGLPVGYSESSPEGANCFGISVCTGRLWLETPECLDYEGHSGRNEFTLTVILKDSGVRKSTE